MLDCLGARAKSQQNRPATEPSRLSAAMAFSRAAGAAPVTIHLSRTELATLLERVLSVSPERISQMESELAGGGSAVGSLEVGLQALKWISGSASTEYGALIPLQHPDSSLALLPLRLRARDSGPAAIRLGHVPVQGVREGVSVGETKRQHRPAACREWRKVSGPQRLWPRSLKATLRHFVLPMNILRARCAVYTMTP